jgi:4-amino-4-deoxy-L-arabinose transferase
MSNVFVNQPKNLHKRFTLLLLFFFLIAYLLPLGALELLVADETRYGEIPREMIDTGDWAVPHLNGLRYFEKPPLGYWVNAASIVLFGENSFAVRFPSALATGLTALILGALIERMLPRREGEDDYTSLLSALIFLSSFEVFGLGNIAVLDSLFSFFLTATIVFLFMATEESPGSARERGFLLLAGLWCGLSFLTKGFLAFAVPALALGPYLIWQRRYRDVIRMGWLPILVAVLVILPWGLWIHWREPDFWRFFFWNEHIRRFMADSAQHKKPLWYFFAAAPLAFMPWTLMIPAAVSGTRERLKEIGPQGRLLRLSVCWLFLPFFFFSVSNGKLLTYILPCFPPFAVLMAFGLLNALKANARTKLFQFGVAGNILIFSLILLPIVCIQLFGSQGLRFFDQTWETVMVINALFCIVIFSRWAFSSGEMTKRAILFGFSPLFLFLIVHFILPQSTLESKAPGSFIDKHKRDIFYDEVIISDENTINAVCWYLQRNNVYILGDPGELDYGLRYTDARGRLLKIKSAVDLINRNRGKTVLFARVDKMPKWGDRLPKPVFHDESGPSGYVFWKF